MNGHHLVLVLLVPLQQAPQPAAQLCRLNQTFLLKRSKKKREPETEQGAAPHLGVQRRVSVVGVLQLVGDKPLDAVQSRVRTSSLLQSALNGVQNFLARDGDEAKVGLVADYIFTQLGRNTFTANDTLNLAQI